MRLSDYWPFVALFVVTQAIFWGVILL